MKLRLVTMLAILVLWGANSGPAWAQSSPCDKGATRVGSGEAAAALPAAGGDAGSACAAGLVVRTVAGPDSAWGLGASGQIPAAQVTTDDAGTWGVGASGTVGGDEPARGIGASGTDWDHRNAVVAAMTAMPDTGVGTATYPAWAVLALLIGGGAFGRLAARAHLRPRPAVRAVSVIEQGR